MMNFTHILSQVLWQTPNYYSLYQMIFNYLSIDFHQKELTALTLHRWLLEKFNFFLCTSN